MTQKVFLRRTLRGFTNALSKALISEQVAEQRGFLQQFDPRVRLIATLLLVISVLLCRRVEVLAGLFALAIVLAISSRVSLATLAKRVWWIAFGFTGLIAIPALFTTPGDPLLAMPLSFTITRQGLRAALLLILRVETAVTLTTIFVLCTRWMHVLKALRSLGVPAEVITMLAMTHRYVFLLIETANQMIESRESRTVGKLSDSLQRSMVARSAGVLLSKSMDVSYDVYLAMMSRGFRGDIRLLKEFRLRARDYMGLAMFTLIGVVAAWTGR
jgi:cobalt/nickel transport system permease protein